MLEKYLIENCSPTLASLKTASLFSAAYESEIELRQQVELWNEVMNKKGIQLFIMKMDGQRVLIYVCRRSQLARNLKAPGVARFLRGYGYAETDLDSTLRHLQERLSQQEGFPHEVGIFLGYPLGDVVGFIKNAGRNYKCAGWWKVYCNECETVKLFEKYRKCREVYARLWRQGRTVMQLTVAA